MYTNAPSGALSKKGFEKVFMTLGKLSFSFQIYLQGIPETIS